MNLEDILLTKKEIADVVLHGLTFATKYPTQLDIDKAIAIASAKAAQIKLLDVLKKPCMHGMVGYCIGECGFCMSELEKLLKEG